MLLQRKKKEKEKFCLNRSLVCVKLLIVMYRCCLLLILGLTSILNAEKYTLSVCSIFKNEAKFLKEWIEYHRLIGVDHFYLYNVASKDQSIKVLQPYIKKGIVSLINWYDLPSHEKSHATWALALQIPAYEHAVKYKAAKDTKWLVFLEIDEFLVPQQADKISDLLKNYEEYPGIILKSDYFDASIPLLPPPKLLIEAITLTGKSEQCLERSIEKTILKPKFCVGFTWPPYRCRFKEGRHPVRMNRNELRINRYTKRLPEDFLFRKIKNKVQVDTRMLTEDEIEELLEADCEVEDQERTIYRFVPDLLKKMGY
jgi:hypothetical protein